MPLRLGDGLLRSCTQGKSTSEHPSGGAPAAHVQDVRPEMKLPPPNILKATLEVMFMCSYTTRNWTLNESVSRKQLNELWEAVHEIPSLLTRWGPDSEQELLMYLDEYGAKWPSPALKACYFNVRDDDAV